jgi:hypothetical protein
MVTIVYTAIGILFFVLGHSTLLVYFTEGCRSDSLRFFDMATPKPSRGKLVSYVSFALTGAFCFLLGPMISMSVWVTVGCFN